MPEAFTSRDGTLGHWSTNAPDDFDFSGDEDGFWPVSRLRQQYVDYLSAKVQEYEEQKQSRHYYHGAQWTPEEIEVLRKRRQPIITFNRVNRKIDSISGLLGRLRQDPKAFPTNPRHADGAEIATQVVQSVLEANNWAFIDNACATQAAMEGIGGIELKLVDGDHDDPDVAIDEVAGEDWFYDPRSTKKSDFSDARYHGIAKWLDVEAAIELFPDKEDELRTLMVETGFDLTTHADSEFKWIYVNEKRLRLVEHWYRHKGKWYWAFYCSMLLLAQGVSPFIDERNQPMSRFIMFSSAVDHDGDRYGFVRTLKGPQDELNQRRSKALWQANAKRLIAQKGAVDSVETARQQYARPDGFVEYNMGFDPPRQDENQADQAAQLQLMQDARQEIDTYININPALLAQSDADEHSGVAINLLQKAGIAELGSFLRNYRSWKLRVYRAIWNVAHREWQAERWIRVTDNQKLAQFIQLNGMETDEWGQPVLVNVIGSLNVEIRMEEGPDEASLMQDVYDQVKGDPSVPFLVKLEFMPMSEQKKQHIRQLMQQPPNPIQVQAAQLGLQKTAADIEDKKAQATERRARSMTDIARAGHLASEAHLNRQQIITEGLQTAANMPGSISQPGPMVPPFQQPGPPPAPQMPPPGPPGGAPMQPGFPRGV